MTAFTRIGAPTAVVLALVVAVPNPARAVSSDRPAPPQAEPAAPQGEIKKSKKKRTPRKSQDQKSDADFLMRYRHAYELIYQNQDYAAGLSVLRGLRQDAHPDVANLVGFASRKLGNYDDARYWYEKALAADPKHTRTWQYYGQWHLEQGNRLKAEEHLERIRAICGTDCEDYKSLDVAIRSGKLAY
jgi:tetratricopeptide (TPR) repeat protein